MAPLKVLTYVMVLKASLTNKKSTKKIIDTVTCYVKSEIRDVS